MKEIVFRPIGFAHTPWKSRKGTPISPRSSRGTHGVIEVLPEFEECLHDVDGFSHISIIFNFHLSDTYKCKVVPYMDTVERGVFATHAPRRPNQIGLSVVRVVGVDGCRLEIEDVDMIDGTPILDIKPYFSAFESGEDIKLKYGWLEGKEKRSEETKDEGQFE
jgi:tRNA (adenine37-N6)-methyltransferase